MLQDVTAGPQFVRERTIVYQHRGGSVMNDFENMDTKDGFSMKLWRGERMCLLGFDVAEPEPDFVGFAIECRSPGATE